MLSLPKVWYGLFSSFQLESHSKYKKCTKDNRAQFVCLNTMHKYYFKTSESSKLGSASKTGISMLVPTSEQKVEN